MFYLYKNFKTSSKPWISITKNTQSTQIELRSLDETKIRRFLQVDRQFSLWKAYGKCQKIQKHEICNNFKKILFSDRTELPQKKMVFKKPVSKRKEKIKTLMN